MSPRPSRIALIAGFVLTSSAAAALAQAPPQILEYPDDPPGIAAQPAPGARPAEPIRFGAHTIVQINIDSNGANIPGDAANEPSIAVDPSNRQRMVVGWRQFDTISSNFRQGGIGYTTDGGQSWTFPGVLTPGVFRSDPVICADLDGNFYYNSLEEDLTTDVFRSNDGGAVWGPEVFAHGGDKQWMTIDQTDGIGRGNIYSYWSAIPPSLTFTRSLDGGDSFANPTSIPQRPQWGTMDIAADGTLWIVGINAGQQYVVSKSTDAENPLDPSPSFVTSSINLGGTISYFRSPNPDGLLGQPWIAVDPSNGPTAGYIYVLGSVNPSGADPLNVNFIRSTDGGTTWSAPIKVNDDAGTSAYQWFGTMSVAPNGRIDAIWNDTRNTGAPNLSQLFYSFSTNGGTTWSANEQLSPTWNSLVGWPNQEKIGDYCQMVSDNVGANLAWAATLNGEQDVYFVRIGEFDCNGNGVGDLQDIANGAPDSNLNDIPDECEGITTDVAETSGRLGAMSNSPNPFQKSTEIEYRMPAAGAARLQIYNLAGQLVRTLEHADAQAGRNRTTWDGTDEQGASVESGIYFCQLDANGIRQTQRMLLLR